MRFSLREMLAVLTVACLAVTALLFANTAVVACVVVAVAIATLVAVDRAIVGDAHTRFVCLGFAIPVLVYGLLAVFAVESDSSPYGSGLWTAETCEALYGMVKRTKWEDLKTGERYASKPEGSMQVGFPFGKPTPEERRRMSAGIPGFNPSQTVVFTFTRPRLNYFMPVAHSLWALFFGYVCMKYAGWVYRRRQKRIAAEGELAAGADRLPADNANQRGCHVASFALIRVIRGPLPRRPKITPTLNRTRPRRVASNRGSDFFLAARRG